MVKKRGKQRSPDYVTSWGEKIEGAYLSTDGRLRPIGKSSPAFGGDEARAVAKFKRWKLAQDKDQPPRDDFEDYLVSQTDPIDLAQVMPEALIEQPEIYGIFRNHFRHLILTDPPKAAMELDVPHLAHYPTIPDKPHFTLDELGKHFTDNGRNNKGKPFSRKYKENTLRSWEGFCDSVRVRYARDLTGALIQTYYDEIMQEYDKEWSASWVRTRFTAVKRIIKWGLERSPDADKLTYRQCLDLCIILRAPSSPADPKPISVEHFHKIYEAASTREKAALLLGINAAMHGGEATGLLKSECDLDAKTLTCRRSKNGYPRVAKLWDRTVKAIRAYMKTTPRNKSDYLFITDEGTPLTSEGLRQCIKRITNRLELTDVTFDGLRDAAYGVAEEVDAHHAKFVAGHKTGMSDKYVLRQATNKKVIACCKAIERHFFGGKKK